MPHAPTRVIVTGHTPDGKAVIAQDEVKYGIDVTTKQPPEDPTTTTSVVMVHRTTGFPVSNQGGPDEFDVANLKRSNPDGSVKAPICIVYTVPPSKGKLPFPFHRNQSMEYFVMLRGSLVMYLDDGVQTTLKAGDVCVQRGTAHSWENTSDEDATYMSVILPAEKVRVETTGEEYSASKLAGLTD